MNLGFGNRDRLSVLTFAPNLLLLGFQRRKSYSCFSIDPKVVQSLRKNFTVLRGFENEETYGKNKN